MTSQSKGILYIIISSFFFALMALLVKFTGGYPIYQQMFFRGIVAVGVLSFTLKRQGLSPKPNHFRLNLLRSIFGATGVFLYYYALSKMTLSDAVMLNKLSPFFVMLFGYLFLKERITKYQVLSIIIALLGATLIIKPSFNSSVLPALLGLGSAMAAGSAYTVVRALRDYDHPRVIVYFFSLFTVLVAVPFMVAFGIKLPGLLDFFLLLGIGLTAMIAQLFMTSGYKHAEASKVSIYSYGNIVFSLIFTITIFSTIPDGRSLLGTGLILFAAFFNYHMLLRKK